MTATDIFKLLKDTDPHCPDWDFRCCVLALLELQARQIAELQLHANAELQRKCGTALVSLNFTNAATAELPLKEGT